MASNVSVQFCSRVSAMDLETLCQMWRPPPLPPEIKLKNSDLYSYAKKDANYQCYSSSCPDHVFDPKIYRSTTTVFVQPDLIHEPVELSVAQAGTGAVVAVMISLIFVLILLVVVGYVWYRKKKRCARTGTLPTTAYENTNYLDNKARSGLCWKPQPSLSSKDDTNEQYTKAEPNKYGSLPHPGHNSVMYINNHNATNNSNGDIVIGAPPALNSVFPVDEGARSNGNCGIANGDFVTGSGEMPSPSPSANSSTPLFDDVDGVVKRISQRSGLSDTPMRNSDSLLPNTPSVSGAKKDSHDMTVTKSDVDARNSVSAKNKSAALPPSGQNGKQGSGSRLPPLDQSQKRSPKKKKPSYLQGMRKSAPLESKTNEGYGDEVDNNRKSM